MSLAAKAEALRRRLNLPEGPPVQIVDQAVEHLGLADELKDMSLADKAEACCRQVGLSEEELGAVERALEAAAKKVAASTAAAKKVAATTAAAWCNGGRNAAEVEVTSGAHFYALALSPDGARLVGAGSVAAKNEVAVYEPSETGCKVVNLLQGPTAGVLCVAIDSAHIVAGDRGPVRSTGGWRPSAGDIHLWNAQTFEPLGKLPKQHSDAVTAVAVHGDQLVSGSHDKTAKLWSLSARAVTATLAEHTGTKTGSVMGVAVSDAAIATGSGDKTARLWSREGGASRHTLQHPNQVNGVAMAGDELVTGCYDKIVRTFSVASGQLTRELRGHTAAVTCVALSGSMMVSGSNDKTVKVWARTGEASAKCDATLEGHGGGVKGVVAGAGWVASQSRGEPGQLIVWRPEHGREAGGCCVLL